MFNQARYWAVLAILGAGLVLAIAVYSSNSESRSPVAQADPTNTLTPRPSRTFTPAPTLTHSPTLTNTPEGTPLPPANGSAKFIGDASSLYQEWLANPTGVIEKYVGRTYYVNPDGKISLFVYIYPDEYSEATFVADVVSLGGFAGLKYIFEAENGIRVPVDIHINQLLPLANLPYIRYVEFYFELFYDG